MTKAEALARLREREAELRELGIERLSIFGSTARGEEGPESDVDLAAVIDFARCQSLWEFMDLQDRVAALMGAKVDLVSEPARKARFQAEIDRDRVHVF